MPHENFPGRNHPILSDHPETRQAELQAYDLNAIRVDIIRLQAQFDTRMLRTERVLENLVHNMATWRQDFIDSMTQTLEAAKTEARADEMLPRTEGDSHRSSSSRHNQDVTMRDGDGGDDGRNDEDTAMISRLRDDIKNLRSSLTTYHESMLSALKQSESIHLQMKDLSSQITKTEENQAVQTRVIGGLMHHCQQHTQQHTQLLARQEQHSVQISNQMQLLLQLPQIQAMPSIPARRPVGRPRRATQNAELKFIACSGVGTTTAATSSTVVANATTAPVFRPATLLATTTMPAVSPTASAPASEPTTTSTTPAVAPQ
ncbi:hypothetical protein BGX34_009582 [Mortierella sp. NVP85]|nr:hypothetical protein BGX34_009582 [Mortierella sp. NVP85]